MKVFRTEDAQDAYGEIVSLLRAGGVIAFPTDTAYGLAADPFSETAVDRIFRIKGRPDTKPILLLVDSVRMAESVIHPSDVFYRVVEAFWPGSLTIIMHAVASLPANVSAGTNTVGVRWPIAAFATGLVSRLGSPVTATSANRSGMPSPVTAEEVQSQLGDSIDALVDGGVLPSSGGSTLLDLTADLPVLLREGPVPFEALVEFFEGRIRRRVA
ncbi:MAG TPA: L-threonylcarbamoyladenylate synthase [Terriglobia bacterium]|nr:L-threonylcarbamoyladenylate synthase [Terriglobia bacterium]